jgi:hypothetical protein
VIPSCGEAFKNSVESDDQSDEEENLMFEQMAESN